MLIQLELTLENAFTYWSASRASFMLRILQNFLPDNGELRKTFNGSHVDYLAY